MPKLTSIRAITIGALATSVAEVTVAGCSSSASSSSGQAPHASAGNVFQIASIELADGRAPLIDFINSAQKSIDVVIYEFDDEPIRAALVAAAQAGKKVRVLMTWQTYLANNTYTNPKAKKYNHDTPTFNALRAGGVDVAWSRHQFPYTHQKSVVVDAGTDNGRALIVDYNFQPSYFDDLASPSATPTPSYQR